MQGRCNKWVSYSWCRHVFAINTGILISFSHLSLEMSQQVLAGLVLYLNNNELMMIFEVYGNYCSCSPLLIARSSLNLPDNVRLSHSLKGVIFTLHNLEEVCGVRSSANHDRNASCKMKRKINQVSCHLGIITQTQWRRKRCGYTHCVELLCLSPVSISPYYFLVSFKLSFPPKLGLDWMSPHMGSEPKQINLQHVAWQGHVRGQRGTQQE